MSSKRFHNLTKRKRVLIRYCTNSVGLAKKLCFDHNNLNDQVITQNVDKDYSETDWSICDTKYFDVVYDLINMENPHTPNIIKG